MKKIYSKPTTEVVKTQLHGMILILSGGETSTNLDNTPDSGGEWRGDEDVSVGVKGNSFDEW